MKFSIVSSLVLLAVTSQALATDDRPCTLPSDLIVLDRGQKQILNNVFKHTDLLSDLAKHGKEVISIQFKQTSENSQTRVFVGSCTVDPAYICSTTAVLVIDEGFSLEDGPYHKAHLETSSSYDMNARESSVLSTLIEALMLNSKDAVELSKTGNRIVEASAQFISPDFSRFQATTRACMRDSHGRDHCLGGARLTLEATTKWNGVVPVTTFKTSLVHFR